jgi:hypothetical protein
MRRINEICIWVMGRWCEGFVVAVAGVPKLHVHLVLKMTCKLHEIFGFRIGWLLADNPIGGNNNHATMLAAASTLCQRWMAGAGLPVP